MLRYLSDEVVERTVVFWAPASKAVGAKRQRVLGSLVLTESGVKVGDEQALPVLIKVSEGLTAVPCEQHVGVHRLSCVSAAFTVSGVVCDHSPCRTEG